MVKQKTLSHPTVKRLFAGRKLVVASMHGKHHVMKPLIRQYLNVDTVIVPEMDTDEFGTFSGEIERPFDAMTTLRKKILKGLKVSGETLGIGNEGSFGPHPDIPFVQANEELVMLIDLQNDIEIVDRVISTETNHARMEILGMKDLLAFTDRIQFPSHGIILKQMKDGKVVKMRKGIITWELLWATSLEYTTDETVLIAETDMRGYLNPTRMRVIELATERLMKKVTSLCPECQWPGFGVVKINSGLACRQCGSPTRQALSKVYECTHCHYSDERYYPDDRKADAQYCDQCNP